MSQADESDHRGVSGQASGQAVPPTSPSPQSSSSANQSHAQPEAPPPEAKASPVRRPMWPVVIVLAAAVFAGVMAYLNFANRGPIIVLDLPHGYGLKPMDAVRCQGVVIGEVIALKVIGPRAVEARLRLNPDATPLVGEGSQFWVVRPEVSLAGVKGLDTIAGARYVVMQPGDGPYREHFVALDEAPVLESLDPAGLEISLIAEARGSLRRGAPVLYRQTPVGVVLSTGLTSDGSAVGVRVYIQPAYVALVRENTMFWNASGVSFDVGWSGLELAAESLQTLVDGGVMMATPDEPGNPVMTGRRFTLLPEMKDDDWKSWRPALQVGDALLPASVAYPKLTRAAVTVEKGTLFKRTQRNPLWLVSVAGHVVGPADLLHDESAATLEMVGKTFPIDGLHVQSAGELSWFHSPVNMKMPRLGAVRAMTDEDELAAFTEPSDAAIPIAAARLLPFDEARQVWPIDPAIPFQGDAHGAVVLSRTDGAAVGILLIERGRAFIAPLQPVIQAIENARPAAPARTSAPAKVKEDEE